MSLCRRGTVRHYDFWYRGNRYRGANFLPFTARLAPTINISERSTGSVRTSELRGTRFQQGFWNAGGWEKLA
jgi:hypothetical protein